MHKPEVVLAVDQVGDFVAVLVGGQVEEVAYPVCLLAYKVAGSQEARLASRWEEGPGPGRDVPLADLLLGHEFLQVSPREAHRLCAGEADLGPPEQVGDFLPQLLEQLPLCPYAGLIDLSYGRRV